jgi:hypothetical protein
MPILVKRRIDQTPSYQPTLSITRALKNGSRGDLVRLAQEWLCLAGIPVALDGRFGPATEQAAREFQSRSGILAVTGVIDPITFGMLVRPMIDALRVITIPAGERPTLADLVITYAQQHLQQRAKEVGGQNRGPWVRLYLKGHERTDDASAPSKWAWCAGFASTIIHQAARTLGTPPPFDYDWNCNGLAEKARAAKRFVRGRDVRSNPNRIALGSLMLIQKKSNPKHYHHTGIVVQVGDGFVKTIEGNSTEENDTVPYGHEVTVVRRAMGSLDFVNLG